MSSQHDSMEKHRCRVVLLTATVLLSSCRQGVLDPRGPVGTAERLMLYDATAIMLAVGVPVILLTLAFAWWFRAGNPYARYRPDWEYSGRIEMIIWSIPALVILFLGGIAWVGSHQLDPPRALKSNSPPLEVQVVSLDWQWLFIYPGQHVASLNHLVIPTSVPVRFSLTSTSVMNSFFIPQLGSQIYTMAGMTTQLNLQADHQGTYRGISAQFSGEGFADMRFDVDAVSGTGFQAWLSGVRASSQVLDAATFTQLASPSRAKGTATYADVSGDLFEAIAAGHPPAASTPLARH
ncbi:MAG: cyoA [Gammaproteobacteria bacterium]|nr:cyoA [Gammaproteobacteria bacterium]